MRYDNDLNFVFANTPKVIFGDGAIADLGTMLSEMGSERAVIVTDPFLAEKTDLLDRVQKAMGPRCAGAFTGVVPDPTAASMDAGAEQARSLQADALVSLGGGSAIDSAKAMAVVLSEGGQILDHEGYHALTRPLLPHIAIPTTAGTGSEMTMVTVVKDPARGQKTFIGSHFLHPVLAVLDPSLTVGLPARLTAATGMDAMCHAVESLFSSLRQPFSDACALQAIEMIATHLPRCIEQADDLEARGQMLIAASLAGTAFSNAMVSLNHALAHSLGARFGIHHGTANAMLLPHTMRLFAEDAAEPLSRAARAMGIDTKAEQAAEATAAWMEQFLVRIGLTDRLADYSVTDANLEEIADMALADGSIIYSPRPIFETQEMVALLRKAL